MGEWMGGFLGTYIVLCVVCTCVCGQADVWVGACMGAYASAWKTHGSTSTSSPIALLAFLRQALSQNLEVAHSARLTG